MRELGYEVSFSGQRTYNGVALLSRAPQSEVIIALPGLDDPQRRVLAATIGDVDLRFEQHCDSAGPALRGKIHWRFDKYPP